MTEGAGILRLGADEALAALGSGRGGLEPAEAARRLARTGPNAIERVRPDGAARRFLAGFTHLFAVLLWAAAAIAFAADFVRPGQGMAMLGSAIVAVIAINGLFAFWQDYRAERMLAALADLLPAEARVWRGGAVTRLPVTDLVPGDLLALEAGDAVPADCRIIEAFGLRVNTATITGESVPHARHARPVDTADARTSPNALLAGTSVVAGDAVAVVFATGPATEFGRIAHLAQATPAGVSTFLAEIAFVSRLVAVLATVLGVVFFLIGLEVGLGPDAALLFGIGIIVANVPEGLLPTVTLALAMAAQRMARRRVLVRHLPAVETLGAATVICTDKTGTLTANRMHVAAILPAGAAEPIAPAKLGAGSDALRRLIDVARQCQTLKPGASERWLGDPMEVALVAMAEAAGAAGTRPLIGEIPFDADRKRLGTIHAEGDDRVLYCKGAPETVLPLCASRAGPDRPLPWDAAARDAVRKAEAMMADSGLRVLALAWAPLAAGAPMPETESGLVFLGLIGLDDPPRPGVDEAVRVARGAGIKVIVTTGDHAHTAVAIARQTGIVTGPRPTVITGDGLDRMSDPALARTLQAPEIVFARLAADQKLRLVRALRAASAVVAVTGDGVNDAPALKEADIGIAMGRSGSDVARAAADLVLVDDDFPAIVEAIEEGRAVFDNVRKFLAYILTSNIPEIVPYLAFVLFGIPLPLTIIQILAVDLGTDMLPALALGAERPVPGIMGRAPRPRRQRLLDAGLLLRAYLFLGPLEALGAMAAYSFVLYGGGWTWGETLAPLDPLYRQSTTACLAAIVVAQIANVYACRSETGSFAANGLFANRLILAGIGFEILLILAIVYTPAGNALFGTAPLPAAVWLFALPFALLLLGAEEARKAVVRRLDSAAVRR